MIKCYTATVTLKIGFFFIRKIRKKANAYNISDKS